MKNENEFNAWMTSQIRKLGTRYKAIKLSDRFRFGVSDWLIFHDGKGIAVESKAIKNLPKTMRGKALKHPVTGPQMTFFESMRLAGIKGYVIVAILDHRSITAVPYPCVPKHGNFPIEAIYEAEWFRKIVPCTAHLKFNFSDIHAMLDQMFYGNALWNGIFR